jgi:hypothetical protein
MYIETRPSHLIGSVSSTKTKFYFIMPDAPAAKKRVKRVVKMSLR